MITHPEKVLFPPTRHAAITKGELAAYYEAIAPIMRAAHPRAADHDGALSGRHRQEGLHPEGRLQGLSRVARARRGAEEGRHRAPSDRHRHAVAALDRQSEHASRRTSGRRARRTSIIPTSASSTSTRPRTIPTCLRAAALGLRDLLKELGLPSWVKTSGSKGFHIVVPLDGKADIGEVAGFAHARRSAARRSCDPEHLTQEFSKADRGKRILVDTGRNGYSATWAAPYAVRAKPGAPVSAPCTWEEVERGDVGPRTFTLRDDGRARRRGRRPVGGPAQAQAVAAACGGEAAADAACVRRYAVASDMSKSVGYSPLRLGRDRPARDRQIGSLGRSEEVEHRATRRYPERCSGSHAPRRPGPGILVGSERRWQCRRTIRGDSAFVRVDHKNEQNAVLQVFRDLGPDVRGPIVPARALPLPRSGGPFQNPRGRAGSRKRSRRMNARSGALTVSGADDNRQPNSVKTNPDPVDLACCVSCEPTSITSQPCMAPVGLMRTTRPSTSSYR